jgi:tetratricopeptide (TPR) repeat protein
MCFALGMNKALISVVVLLLVFAVGCKRKGGTNSSNPADGSSASSGVSPNPSQARAFLEKGKLLYRNDQDSEAAEAFKQAISLDPTLAEAHFRLGLASEALNKAQEADDEYKKAVEGLQKSILRTIKTTAMLKLIMTGRAMRVFTSIAMLFVNSAKRRKPEATMRTSIMTWGWHIRG